VTSWSVNLVRLPFSSSQKVKVSLSTKSSKTWKAPRTAPAHDLLLLRRMHHLDREAPANRSAADGLTPETLRTCRCNVLNDQDGGLVCVVVSLAHDPQRLVPEVDRVTDAPVRHSGAQRRRVGALAVRRLQPEQESSHPVLLSGAGRLYQSMVGGLVALR
jgi:hypothetical protein